MKFNEYMQVEITSENNKVQLSPVVKLDKKYEVGLLDVMYVHHPHKKLRLHGVDVINTTELEILFHLQVQKEGLIDDAIRTNFISTWFGLGSHKAQAKEFDMWNYGIIERSMVTLELDPITAYFDKNPVATLSIHQMVDLINDALTQKSEEIKQFLKEEFSGTSGRNLITTDQYFELPKLSIDTNKNMVVFSLPYYVKELKLAGWLNKLLGLFTESEAVFERKLFNIPSPLIRFDYATQKFNWLDRTQQITNVLPSTNFELGEGVNIFIYCSLIEYRYIGNIKSPILKMLGLSQNKRAINWIQFSNPHYLELRYNEIGEFEIAIFDERGKQFDFEGKLYLTLHFREKT